MFPKAWEEGVGGKSVSSSQWICSVLQPHCAGYLFSLPLAPLGDTFEFIYFQNILLMYFQRGEGRKRGRGTSMCGCFLRHSLLGTWPATRACALTRSQTSDSAVHRPALSPLSHTSHGGDTFKFRQLPLTYPSFSSLLDCFFVVLVFFFFFFSISL